MQRINDFVISMLNRFLSSVTGLYIALIVPLVCIFAPAWIQKIENILSSNWLQLWALFVLAIIAVRGQAKHNDKLDAIHQSIKEQQ